MKIAFDAKRAAQNRTGLGNYSRFVIEGLATYYKNNEYLLYIPNQKRTNSLGNLDRQSNCIPHYPDSSLWKQFPSLWRVYGLTKQLQKDSPLLYHGLSNELPRNIEQIKRLKTVVTIHDLIFLRYPEFYPFIDRHIYTHKFRSACERADSIIAVSECTKRDIIHYFQIAEEKIKVIYQGCDEGFRSTASTELCQEARDKYQLPEKYLLYVGSIESRKNLMRIVEALSQTRCRLPLVAVGKHTAYADLVMSKARALGLSDRIHLIHNAQFRHFPALYQMSSAFIYPSYFEGFGIPLLEALCSGVPVIGATGSCLEEAGGPHSLYVDPNDSNALANAIDQVIETPSLREEMVRKGLTYAERFKPDVLAREMMEHYHSLLSSK